MGYKNIKVEFKENYYVVTHNKGKLIQFTCLPEDLNSWVLKARLRYFDKHGTMEGY